MKKAFIILASLVILASCANQSTETNSGSTNTQSGQTSENNLSETKTAKYVKYTLRDTDENGEILDSNTDSSESLKVVMGTNSVIKGFEENLKDMKEGETKSFTVLPKDGYGEATIEENIDIKAISPTSLQTVEKSTLEGKNKVTILKSDLNEQGLEQIKGKKAGDIIEDNEVVTVKLIEETEENITIESEYKTNPFKDKELTPGLQVEDENGIYKIISINENTVSVEFTNKHSPFYNKELKAGAIATTEYGEITIVEINGETAKVRVPNTNRLAGKTLYFTVTVEKIEEEKTENTKIEPEFNIEHTEEISH